MSEEIYNAKINLSKFRNDERAAKTITYNAVKDLGDSLPFIAKCQNRRYNNFKCDFYGAHYYVDDISSKFGTKNIAIMVLGNPIYEEIAIMAKSDNEIILRYFTCHTINQAICYLIELEILANEILLPYEHIERSFIYKICKTALIFGFTRWIYFMRFNNKPLMRGNNGSILLVIPENPNPIILLFREEHLLHPNRFIDGSELQETSIITTILDKVIKQEYDYPEIYKDIAISHVKRAN